MKTYKKWVITIFAVCAVMLFRIGLTNAQADTPDCKNPVEISDKQYCAEQEFKKADEKLNALYNKIIKKCNAEQKMLFENSQKAWKSYRSNECNFMVHEHFGTDKWKIVKNKCMTEKTKKRIRELNELLKKMIYN